MLNSIGSRLAHIRGAMTQAEFSKALGIGRTTLIRYESDDRQPDASTLIALYTRFAIDPLWLLMGEKAYAIACEGRLPGSQNPLGKPVNGLAALCLEVAFQEQYCSEAFRAGFRAREFELMGQAKKDPKLSECKYPPDTPEHNAWQAGYLSGNRMKPYWPDWQKFTD
uniref:HTH cro/C1-type domain-containing protein n=1 Tax=Marinobacter nauticus TaxID=2743 RepID=A0A455WER1_MARNT|nr:hypothetical protein YBY_30240 [Marinobacter nauticus]